jgi:subtilisin-like proprotein convertase family protein
LSKSPVDAKVSSLILNLNISTAHVGDLVVWLQSPDGVVSVLHDSEGAGEDNLIKVDKDLTSEFEGALANGMWQLKIQDRLKGDIAIFNSFKLEVGTD